MKNNNVFSLIILTLGMLGVFFVFLGLASSIIYVEPVNAKRVIYGKIVLGIYIDGSGKIAPVAEFYKPKIKPPPRVEGRLETVLEMESGLGVWTFQEAQRYSMVYIGAVASLNLPWNTTLRTYTIYAGSTIISSELEISNYEEAEKQGVEVIKM